MARCLARGTLALLVRAYYLSFSYIINKALDVSCITNLALLVFLFLSLALSKTTILLHTLAYHNADPYPLWIPLITALLLPIMTLKIRSTKPRTKVRMIVKCLGSFLDCCYRKRGPYNLMKSQWNQ